MEFCPISRDFSAGIHKKQSSHLKYNKDNYMWCQNRRHQFSYTNNTTVFFGRYWVNCMLNCVIYHIKHALSDTKWYNELIYHKRVRCHRSTDCLHHLLMSSYNLVLCPNESSKPRNIQKKGRMRPCTAGMGHPLHCITLMKNVFFPTLPEGMLWVSTSSSRHKVWTKTIIYFHMGRLAMPFLFRLVC